MKKLFYIGAMSALLLTACGVEKAVTDNAQEESEKAKEKEAEKEEKRKAKEDEKLAKQKEYFVKNTQPAIEDWTKSYDQLWDKLWKPTFEAIGNGSTDVYTAYDNMKALKEGYRELSVKNSIPAEGLSKEQKKAVKEAMRELNYAVASRQMAAEKAMKMFDEGNFAPSQMDKIKSDIASSDSQLLKGVAGITMIKQELGLIEKVKK